jgi:predicted CoA-binding protein
MKMETVAVLGASPNPDRYANKAIRRLLAGGHKVIPVNPGHDEIEGLAVAPRLSDIHEPVDTLTVYVGRARMAQFIEPVLALRPGRVILNPGTESEEFKRALAEAGIPCLEACTLVMLATKQF